MDAGARCLSLLCLLALARGQADFDLADALDDPADARPTGKPVSELYPRLPVQPRPPPPDPHADVYPRPRPQPRPQPPRPDAFGGGGGGAADGSPTQDGHDHGSLVARIVSPVVSVAVVALVGAGVRYFRSSGRGRCVRGDADAAAEVV